MSPPTKLPQRRAISETPSIESGVRTSFMAKISKTALGGFRLLPFAGEGGAAKP